MKMDQTPGEINTEAAESQTAFLDRIDLLLNRQTELCIAARLILDQSEDKLSGNPAIPALQGIISAIAATAKEAGEELDGEYCEEAVKCLHS